MAPKRPHLEWLRQNVLQHLSRADQALTHSMQSNGDNPWITRLFERRQRLQATLADLERQINQR